MKPATGEAGRDGRPAGRGLTAEPCRLPRIVSVLSIETTTGRRPSLLLGAFMEEVFTVETAATVDEGIDALSRSSFDVVLLEVCSRAGGGLEPLRRLRVEQPDIPVVLLNDMSDAGDRVALQAIGLGAQDYLQGDGLTTSGLSRALLHTVARSLAARNPKPPSHAWWTKMARRQRHLERMNKELEAFNHSLAHDLRGPLCTLIGMSEILSDECLQHLDANGRYYLERICKVASSMERVIEGMVELTRGYEKALQRRRVNLSALVRDICEERSHEEPHRGVTCLVEDGVEVLGDPRMLEIVVDNLVGNAWKFTASSSSARIEFGRKRLDGVDVIFVRDDGPGFDPSVAGSLFKPFFKMNEGMHGLGVGLSIVHRIISRHGGKLWAESSPGNGASFYFTLGG